MNLEELEIEITRLYNIRKQPGNSPWFRDELDAIFPFILQYSLNDRSIYLSIQMFAEFYYEKSRTFIEKYIYDSNEDIRRVALKALTSYWRLPEYWQIAIDTITQDEEIFNRSQAISYLAHMKHGTGDKFTICKLSYVVLDQNQEMSIRFHAYEAMQQIQDLYLERNFSSRFNASNTELNDRIDWEWVNKMHDIDSELLCFMNPQEKMERVIQWSKKWQPLLAELLNQDIDYSLKIFQLENSEILPRQDLLYSSQFESIFGYFFNELFKNSNKYLQNFQKLTQNKICDIIQCGILALEHMQTNEIWFQFIRKYGDEMGFAPTYKQYLENEDGLNPKYIGYGIHIMVVLRLAITGRRTGPNLYEIIKILGVEQTLNRLQQILQKLKNL